MKIYDDPGASGGQYIGTDDGIGNENSSPPPDGIAMYSFTVPTGVYKILFRVIITGGSNSYWHDVFSDDDDEDATVLFTLPAGTYTLEIGYRQDGAKLDAIVISKID
jgi:hypothetical protein